MIKLAATVLFGLLLYKMLGHCEQPMSDLMKRHLELCEEA